MLLRIAIIDLSKKANSLNRDIPAIKMNTHIIM